MSPAQVAKGDYHGYRTIWEGYRDTATKRIPDRQQLGTRDKVNEVTGVKEYSWKTYGEVYDIKENMAKGKARFV